MPNTSYLKVIQQEIIDIEDDIETNYLKNISISNLNMNGYDIIDARVVMTDDVKTSNHTSVDTALSKINNFDESSSGVTTINDKLIVGNVETSDIKTSNHTSVDSMLSKINNFAPSNNNETTINGNLYVNDINTDNIYANKFITTGGTNLQYVMGDGTTLQYSANSGNSNYYLYTNDTSGVTNPGAGLITYNNSAQGNATVIYISHKTRDLLDIDVFFKNLSTLNDVYIQDQEDSSNSITYNITSAPTIIPNSYITILVTKTSSSGTGQTTFGNGTNILLSFFSNLIETDTRISVLETKTQNIKATSSVAIGQNAGTNQSTTTVAIGNNAGSGQLLNAIAIGNNAGLTGQRAAAISIGSGAGSINQQASTIAIGENAGSSSQQSKAIAIGVNAGFTGQNENTVAIGYEAGKDNQQLSAISIGYQAGFKNQKPNSIALGVFAGFTGQGQSSIAVGSSAGYTNQGDDAIAMGSNAGNTGQGTNAIAIGEEAGRYYQQQNAIAIGTNAGRNQQGNNAIAIGNNSGALSQKPNTIILNASGTDFPQSANSSFYVNPIRTVVPSTAQDKQLYWNNTTFEVYASDYPQTGTYTTTDMTSSTITFNRSFTSTPSYISAFYKNATYPTIVPISSESKADFTVGPILAAGVNESIINTKNTPNMLTEYISSFISAPNGDIFAISGKFNSNNISLVCISDYGRDSYEFTYSPLGITNIWAYSAAVFESDIYQCFSTTNGITSPNTLYVVRTQYMSKSYLDPSVPVPINGALTVDSLKTTNFIKVGNTLMIASVGTLNSKTLYMSSSTNNGTTWTTVTETTTETILTLRAGPYTKNDGTVVPFVIYTSGVVDLLTSVWKVFYYQFSLTNDSKLFLPEISTGTQIYNILTTQTTSYLVIIYTLLSGTTYTTYCGRTLNPVTTAIDPSSAVNLSLPADGRISTLIENKGRLILSYFSDFNKFKIKYSDNFGLNWSSEVSVPNIHNYTPSTITQRLLCVDKEGNLCANGGRFARSIDNGTSFSNTISYIAYP